METIIQALVWIGLGIAVIIIIVVATGGRSIGQHLLSKDVINTVNKTMPGAVVADAAALSHGEIEVKLVGRQGKMKVYRRSGLMIGVFVDESASIPKTGMFQFIAPRAIPDDSRVDAAAVDQRIKAAFSRSIAEKGFTPAESTKADLLVTYHVALDGSVDDTQIRNTYGYQIPDMSGGQADAASEQPIPLEKASLIIDFIDPDGKKLIWRASLLTNIVVEVSDEDRTHRINDAIKKMLTFFPPK